MTRNRLMTLAVTVGVVVVLAACESKASSNENECVPLLRQRTDMQVSKPDVEKPKSWFERWFGK